MSEPRLEALGDTALLLRWEARIDAATVQHVHAVARALRDDAPGFVVDIVPAYASVAVFVDPQALASGLSMASIESWCARIAASAAESAAANARLVEIAVRYDGPDLANVARSTGFGIEEVVARHAAPDYRVAMLGFAPGFPYLLGLDPALAVPRHAQPRTRVPAGSVGIAGAQTGVYPKDSPGGWQLIGRTAAVLFDATRDAPSLVQPGDRVRFVPLT